MDKKSLGTSALAALFALLLLCCCVLWAGARTPMPAAPAAMEGGSEEPSAESTDEPSDEPSTDEPSTEPETEPTTEPACKTTGEHTPGAWTCNGSGAHTSVCTVCGEPLSEPCDYGDPVVYTPAGDGTHEKTCAVCGGKVSEDCAFGGAVTTKPTQTAPGTRTRTCARCGYQEIAETAAPEGTRKESAPMGDVDGSGNVDTDDARAILRAAITLTPIAPKKAPFADLDENGRITPEDARLALRIAVSLDPQRRHQIISGRVTAPTCTAEGSMTGNCAYCDFNEKLTLPADGHRWTGPTATQARRCSVCGKMLTGWQTLNGKSVYYNADGSVTAGRSLLYTEYRGKKLETLSKGNQQKIQLITAIAHSPDMIILDEPFSGLDPVNAMMLKDVVRELIEKKKLVLFSSHQMSYVEEFCDDIAIINNGGIALCGDLLSIKKNTARDKLVVRSAEYEKIAYEFRGATTLEKKEEVVLTLDDPSDKRRVMKEVAERFDVDEIKVFEPTLNDIFVKYAGDGKRGWDE